MMGERKKRASFIDFAWYSRADREGKFDAHLVAYDTTGDGTTNVTYDNTGNRNNGGNTVGTGSHWQPLGED
jgi:hypothetical protein